MKSCPFFHFLLNLTQWCSSVIALGCIYCGVGGNGWAELDARLAHGGRRCGGACAIEAFFKQVF